MAITASWRGALVAGLWLGLSGCSVAQSVSCDPAKIGYSPSKLGIDYRKNLTSPLAEILSQGEVERLKGMQESGSDLSPQTLASVKTLWRAMINQMFAGNLAAGFTGTPSEPSFDLMRGATPQMFARLKACGPAADPRLKYLRDVPDQNNPGNLE